MAQNLEGALDRIEAALKEAWKSQWDKTGANAQQAEQALADIQAIRDAITQDTSDE